MANKKTPPPQNKYFKIIEEHLVAFIIVVVIGTGFLYAITTSWTNKKNIDQSSNKIKTSIEEVGDSIKKVGTRIDENNEAIKNSIISLDNKLNDLGAELTYQYLEYTQKPDKLRIENLLKIQTDTSALVPFLSKLQSILESTTISDVEIQQEIASIYKELNVERKTYSENIAPFFYMPNFETIPFTTKPKNIITNKYSIENPYMPFDESAIFGAADPPKSCVVQPWIFREEIEEGLKFEHLM